MNVSELLKPLVDKSIEVRGYSRELAVEKSHLWLAKEIGVPVNCLHNLTYEQKWCAEAAVEKALTPPPKKRKKKFDPPSVHKQTVYKPLPKEFWLQYQREWGTEFYAKFFGDWTDVKVEGTLAPGQYAITEIKKANKSALIDAA